MIRLQVAMVGLRAALVGVVIFVAVGQFVGSSAAQTLRDLWQQYLGSLPLGPATAYLAVNAPLVISLGLLAAPSASALVGQGPRALVWLVVASYVLLTPAALATSWIDWFRFLGEDAVGSLDSPSASVGSSLAGVLVTAGALFLLWQTDRLQRDVGRMRVLGMSIQDVLRFAAGHAAMAGVVGAGAIALGGAVYAVAAGVMMAAGELDPRSWISVGAVLGGLLAVGGTVATVATLRSR